MNDIVFNKLDSTRISKIQSAGASQTMLAIKYKDRKGKLSERIVEPYKLVGNDFWGYDPTKENIRRFKVKNIKSAKNTKTKYDPRWDIEMEGVNNMIKTSEFIDYVLEKKAKQMPYLLPNGNYAAPRHWEPGGDEDELEQEYFRNEHKIPKNYKRIADDGLGNSTFVDVNSDKNNPDYYDWDHETTELTKWTDEDKLKAFKASDKENEVFNKLKGFGVDSGYKINDLTLDQMKSLGYTEPKKPNLLDKAKVIGKSVGDTFLPQTGATFGAMAGMAYSNPDNLRQVAKRGGLGMLVGAGIGTALGAGLSGLSGDLKKLKNDNAPNEFKNQLKDHYYDGLTDHDFLSQYKTASCIVNESFEKIRTSNF